MRFKQAIVEDAAQHLAQEIMVTARQRANCIMVNKRNALFCAHEALAFCEEFEIVDFDNIKKIAILMAFKPETFCADNVFARIISQRSVEENSRIALIRESGIFDDLLHREQ